MRKCGPFKEPLLFGIELSRKQATIDAQSKTIAVRDQIILELEAEELTDAVELWMMQIGESVCLLGPKEHFVSKFEIFPFVTRDPLSQHLGLRSRSDPEILFTFLFIYL
jgi:hypothetical protein